MRKVEFIVRRVLKAALVVLGVVVLNFFLIRLAPGDPAMFMAGEAGQADAEYVEQLREQFGLTQPLHVQFYRYMEGLLTMDLGYSFRFQQDAGALIMQRMPATILLAATAYVFAILVGVTTGAIAARRVGTWTDTTITVVALAVYATPLFWLGIMAIILFSLNLGWFPAYGMETIGGRHVGFDRVLDIAHHLVLPAVTLGLFYVAVYARLTRASMLEVADMDFVRTARAKGVPEGRVLRAHVLRNAILPIITFAGLNGAHMLSGSVLIETVYAWPGIGRLIFDALLQRDYNMLLGALFVIAVIVVVFNLITDLIYSIVDPRIELAR